MAVDLMKNEREFEQFNMSDFEVVKYIILYRNKVDILYGANVNINIERAGDVFEFNQEIIALYTSLDVLVNQASLTKKQLNLLKYLYDGNTVNDVCKLLKLDRVATYQMLDRIVDKIVSTNNENWYYTVGKNGYILRDK